MDPKKREIIADGIKTKNYLNYPKIMKEHCPQCGILMDHSFVMSVVEKDVLSGHWVPTVFKTQCRGCKAWFRFDDIEKKWVCYVPEIKSKKTRTKNKPD